MEISTLARWTIRPRLMAIPGVANVAIWGQRDRQLQVLVDPDRLRANNLTLTDVVTAAREGTAVAAGGYLETPQQRLAIAHFPAVSTPNDLRQIIVRPSAHRRRRHPGRPGQCPAHRRRRRSRRGLSAANRRCGDQRRRRPDADRREAAGRQHAPGHARRRSGDGGAEARAAGRRDRHHHLPPGDVHRDVAGEPQPRAAHRLRAGDPRPDRLPLRLAHGAHQHHRHPVVADRRGAGAALSRRHARHHGHRRAHHRPRRGRRRCDHRRGEYRPAAAAQCGRGESALGIRRRARCLRRSAQRRRLWQPDRHPRLRSGVPARGACRARSSGRWRSPMCWRSSPRCSSRSSSRRRCRCSAAEAHARTRGAGRHAGERAVPPIAAGTHRRTEARDCHRRDLAGGDRRGLPAARRGVPAELPGVRLPDALGREAGHVARGDAARHGQRRP